MSRFEEARAVRAGTLDVDLPLAQAWPLFTPEGERARRPVS